MNVNSLILTEHRLMHRSIDVVLTLLAWSGFLFFLYGNLVMKLTESGGMRWNTAVVEFNVLLIAALNGWLLTLWYQYNRRRPHFLRHTTQAPLANDELARSFNIAPQMISEMSQYNWLTLFHDHTGQIAGLKTEPRNRKMKRR